jgi:predicted NUDIX family NTP pyrophosphohydrolase
MKLSAGILLYRLRPSLQVLLVHPGGPFWTRKDVWGIPKGEYDEILEPLEAARREFEEEVGSKPPDGETHDLGQIKISSGKVITAWAIEGDLDVSSIRSNTVLINWPPRSGKKMEVPEVDKAAWMPAEQAITKMHKGQEAFVERLAEQLGVKISSTEATLEPTQSSLF